MSDPADGLTKQLAQLAYAQLAAGLSLEDIAVALLVAAFDMSLKAGITAAEVRELADSILAQSGGPSA